MDRFGQPRKTILPTSREVGKLATYIKALTLTVSHDRFEELVTSIYGSHHLRHNIRKLCNEKLSSNIHKHEIDRCEKKETEAKVIENKSERSGSVYKGSTTANKSRKIRKHLKSTKTPINGT